MTESTRTHVYLLTYSHKHGSDAYVYGSLESAYREGRAIVEDWYQNELSDRPDVVAFIASLLELDDGGPFGTIDSVNSEIVTVYNEACVDGSSDDYIGIERKGILR